VDTATFKPKDNGSDNKKIKFSWIGTAYSPRMGENISFILEAFSLLAAKFDNVFLDCAGEGRYYDEIASQMDNYRYKDRVNFCGWIPPDKIPAYLGGIDIGLLPLIQDTRFNRAKSPTKLFEYMAMGKPVVSSDIGEASLVIKDGKNGFLAKKSPEFIDKMEVLAKDAILRRQLGNDAREEIEKKYSLNVLGKQLYGIIKDLNA